MDNNVFVNKIFFPPAVPNGYPVAVKGPVSYNVQLIYRTVVHTHLDHIRSGMSWPSNGEVSESHNNSLAMMPSIELSADELSDNFTDNIDNPPQLQRSQTTIRPPSHYRDPEAWMYTCDVLHASYFRHHCCKHVLILNPLLSFYSMSLCSQ